MMHFRFQKAATIAAFFVSFALCASLQAQQHPLRIKHVPDLVRNGQASAVGQLETDHPLHLIISLPLRNEDALNTLLQQIYDPQNPNFHHYLTSQQFTDGFEPVQQDYDAVIAWAKAKGLQVTATTASRRLIEVDAPAGTINRAFNVQLKTYQDNRTGSSGRTFHAPDREPTVDLSVPLLAVSGMDDANPPHTHLKKGKELTEASNTLTESLNTPEGSAIVGSGPSNTYLPSDMRAAYYGSGPLDGTGQTVAIFSFDDYLPADLNVYYTHTGMSTNVPVTNVYVNGYNTPCFGFNSNGTINFATCNDGEQILDIVNVIGMAPGLQGVLFYEGSSAVSTLEQIASDNKASVISSSWGGGDFGPACDPSFLQFQAQGQTYLNATGDDGEFNSSTYDPPSVDPNILQVGGTDLVTMAAGGPWSSETGWADSGGGFISGTAIPTWQQTTGVITATNKGSTTLRNSPDVAAEANFDNTTVINGKFSTSYGGTSYATPRWAGFIALANQQSVANGNGTLGFLNPTIYSIGLGSTYAANFHDITSGLNKSLAGTGPGFPAVAGYDLITGWGSPNAALIATLAGSAAPDYSLTASPSPLTVAQGSSGTTTVTVNDINGFSGLVALSATLPSGVTASFSPTSTAGTSTMTLTVSSTAATGSKAVTITGASGGLSHTANLSLNITSGADYSLSASPTSVGVVQGTAGTSTVTVTPINSFSGSVALSATGLPAGVTASFSPASATTTSTLTLAASSIATLGQATVTITGTSGSLTHTTTITLTVAPAPDYSLAASPSSVSVVQGTTGSSTVTVTPLNSFNGSVALSATGLPAGVTASFSPASATSTSTPTLTASSTATLGLATVTITGTSGSLTHTTTVAVTITPAPDYSLSASPNSLSVVQGTAGSSTISVTGLNNFAGSVALAASGLPAGVTASFSPASATSTSTLTLTASTTATLGLATVTITGTSGSLTHTTTVAVTITPAADYSLAASPSSVSVVQGTAGTSTVTVTPLNGFAGSVALSATGLPVGVTASFSPASATSTSTLTLTASGTASLGSATVTITGTSGSLTHTTTVALTITPAPDYSLSSSPNSLSVVQGTTGSSTISVTGLNNFTGSVALAASGLPAGVTASFSPASATSTSTLTLTASGTATLGLATVTITGTSGSLTHTTSVALTVKPAPDYSLSATAANVIQGASGTSTIAVTDLNGFTSAVNLTASGLPTGVTASFNPASTTGSSVLTLTATSTATAGPATVTITGTSGSLTHTATFALTVLVPDYSLSATPSIVTLPRGLSAGSTIAVSDLNGFSGAVNLTVSGLPLDVSASFSPASTTTGSTLTLTALSYAPVGSSTLTITGVSGGLVHTATIALTVTTAPDFSLSLSPTTFTIPQGGNANSTVTVTGINTFSNSVGLTIAGLPTGVTASFSPASTTGTSILTLTAANTAAVGTRTLTITGTSGSLSHSIYASLVITASPSYSLSATPASVAQGATGTSTVSVTEISGFTGSVALSASGLPTGVTASFSPATTTSTSTLTFTALSTAPIGPATVTVTGISGSFTQTATVALNITSAADYSLSASPATVVQGASGSSTVTLTDISGFTGAASLSASGLPAGVTASFSPSSTTSTSTLTLTASGTATVGTATVTVTGVSGSLTHTTTFTLTVVPAPDYSLSASPSNVSIVQGNSGTSTITVTGINSFAGSVGLSASGLPSGVTASFSPSSTTGTSILTLTASGTATAGPATITVTGVSGSLTHTTTIALTVIPAPDYSLSATPNAASVVQGTSGTSTVTVTGINSFTGSVNLAASGLPTGVTASFSPASTTSTSILTLTASATATVGQATITITGTSGSLTHTTTVALTITPAPDYSLSASLNSVTVVQGASAMSTIMVTDINSFTGPVTLTASGLPSGVTASFSPSTTTDDSVLTITAPLTATVGSTTITITGTSGSIIHSTTFALIIAPAPDYSLSASPTSASIVQGNSGTSTITVNGINSFTGSVALSASGLPAGVTASFSPSSTTSSSILTLTASGTATVGPATITITGASGSLTHTTTVTLTIIPAPDYSLSATPNNLSVVQGNAGVSTITVTGLNNFTGSVALSARGLPAGVTASFSPTTTTGTSTLTLTASSTASLGLAQITICGNSGGLFHTTVVSLTVTAPPDYALSATPVNVIQGNSATGTVTVIDLNGFTGAVNLTASGVPAGVTASFNPTGTAGTSVLTLTAATTAAAGSSVITVTGVSGSLTHTTTFVLTVLMPDYSLSATANALTIPRGSVGTSTIAVSDLNGFSGAVSLTLSGLPSGVSAAFSPATTTTGSTLTVTSQTWAAMGTSTLTITGNSGGLVHTTTVLLTVPQPPDFSFALSPNNFSVAQGTSQGNTITVTGLNGFNGVVALSVSGLRSGMTASFSPVSTSGTSIMTLTASSTATVGSGTIIVTGTSGSLSHQIYVSAVVTAGSN